MRADLPAAIRLAPLVDELTPRAVRAAVVLGVPDALAEGELSLEDLARRTDSQAPSLARLLRYLVAIGIVTRTEGARFALTPLGQPLRSDSPNSFAPFLRWSASPDVVEAWSQFPMSIRNGRSAYELRFGRTPYEYWAEEPGLRRPFDEFMAARSEAMGAEVARVSAWSEANSVVDVGGGSAALVVPLLVEHARLRGYIFDRPEALQAARIALEEARVADRCQLVSGDFFSDAIPAAHDVYLLSSVLHNWDDDRALELLCACRRVCSTASLLVLVEFVVPPGDAFHPSKALDLVMLAGFGGKERTAEEIEQLLARSGFSLRRAEPLDSGPYVIEAVVR